jgi:CheY-like chemotaxis protein
MTGVLGGKKVLVVEDEPLVALLVADFLEEAGCIVVGPAYDLNSALTLFEAERPDAAVLDINLGTEQTSAPIADLLEQASIPFVYATGYGAAALRTRDRDRPRIDKPFDKHNLWRILSVCLTQEK